MEINVIEEVPVLIRNAFEPTPGYVWVSADYSQLEYRTMANLAMDKGLIDSFNAGIDFHTATASMMLGIPVDKVGKKERKIGKCVTGDTLIYSSSHGLIRIDEISDFRGEDKFIPLNDFYTLNMYGEKVKAESFYYGGKRKVTNIITRYGFKLGGSTDKHRIIVLDENGFPVYKKMADLTLDDKVVLYLGGFKKDSDEYVKFDSKLVAELKIRENNSTWRNKYKNSFVLEVVDENLAELWGMILSDGYFSEEKDFISFGSADRENIDRFVFLCKQLWPYYEPKIRYAPTKKGVDFWNVWLCSTIATSQLAHGNFGRKGETLHLPAEILKSKDSVKAAFLAGWFNGDGCFSEKFVNTCSISKDFIYEMQQLFLSMGILTSVRSEIPTIMKGTDYLAWKLDLVDDYACSKFYDYVYDLLIKRKKEKFDLCMNRFKKYPSCLQVTYNLKESVIKAMPGLTLEQRKNKYRHINKGVNSYGYATLKDLYISESSSSEVKDLISKFINHELIALPIKEIFETEEEVFDLYIPHKNQFISNGFPVHNTLNFGVSYGMSPTGLAGMLGCTKEEAAAQQQLYFKNIPGISNLIEKTKAEVKARGYSRTFFGRIRNFKKLLEAAQGNWYKEDSELKKSFNTTVQGTGADFAKIALGRVHEAVKPYGDKVRLLTQVHDEINYEVKCVREDGTIDVDFLSEVLKVIDYAMSFRGIMPGWADIPADIEIGWNYGSLESGKDAFETFGVDLDTLFKDAPATDLPPWLLENLDYDNLGSVKVPKTATGKSQKGQKQAEKSSVGKSSSNSEKGVEKASEGSSVGQKMAREIESRMRTGSTKVEGRLDLSKAVFKVSTVVIHKKEGASDIECFNLLKKHVAENFGQNDLVLEEDGMLYKIPDEYRINDNIDDLYELFDVDVFKVMPKVILS